VTPGDSPSPGVRIYERPGPLAAWRGRGPWWIVLLAVLVGAGGTYFSLFRP
jgi:hypothetical protein